MESMTKYYVKDDNPYVLVNLVAKFRRDNERLVRKSTEYLPGTLPGAGGGRVIVELITVKPVEYTEDDYGDS